MLRMHHPYRELVPCTVRGLLAPLNLDHSDSVLLHGQGAEAAVGAMAAKDTCT